MNQLQEVEKEFLRSDIPEFRSGDTVRVHVKVHPSRWYYWCDQKGLLVWQDMVCSRKFNANLISSGWQSNRTVKVSIVSTE